MAERYKPEKERREENREQFQKGHLAKIKFDIRHISDMQNGNLYNVQLTGHFTNEQIHELFFEIWDLVGNKTLQKWIKSEPGVKFIIK